MILFKAHTFLYLNLNFPIQLLLSDSFLPTLNNHCDERLKLRRMNVTFRETTI